MMILVVRRESQPWHDYCCVLGAKPLPPPLPLLALVCYKQSPGKLASLVHLAMVRQRAYHTCESVYFFSFPESIICLTKPDVADCDR